MTQAGDAADVINRNMAVKMAYLSSPLVMNPGEALTVPFNDVPPGTYEYHCTPHLAMGQKGIIIVDPRDARFAFVGPRSLAPVLSNNR